MNKKKYHPKELTGDELEHPDPPKYDVDDRVLLNKVRLKHFLSPDGTNRRYFKRITKDVIFSLLDWYLPDTDESNDLEGILYNDYKLKDYIESEIIRKLEDGSLRFDNLYDVKDAVDGSITHEEAVKLIPEKLPEKHRDLSECLPDIDKHTNPSIRFNQLFLGEIHPHDFIPSFEAGLVSKFLNHNAIAQKVSPTITYIERRVVEWLRSIIGYEPQNDELDCIGGNIVSGGTLANLTAMVVARNKKYSDGDGTPTVFVSKRAHYSLKGKVANTCGIGSENVVEVDVDNNGRIDISDLEDKIIESIKKERKPIAVMATAGTTEQGAIDPLKAIGEIAKKYNLYYHVDAALGGAFLISPEMRSKFIGIDMADSVTIDGHKMFYVNYPCGGIVFKDPSDPMKYIKQEAAYVLKEGEHYNAGSQTIEGSRGTDGIMQLYLGMLALGREGYSIVHQHVNNMTKYLYEVINWSDEFEALHEPELNSLLYKYNPKDLRLGELESQRENIINEINSRIPGEAYKDGRFYVGETEIGGKYMIRAVVVHPYTETETIDAYLKFVNGVAEAVTKDVVAEYRSKIPERFAEAR